MCNNARVFFSSYGFLKWEFAFIHQVGQRGSWVGRNRVLLDLVPSGMHGGLVGERR